MHRDAADVDEWLTLVKTLGLRAEKPFVKEKQGHWLLYDHIYAVDIGIYYIC